MGYIVEIYIKIISLVGVLLEICVNFNDKLVVMPHHVVFLHDVVLNQSWLYFLVWYIVYMKFSIGDRVEYDGWEYIVSDIVEDPDNVSDPFVRIEPMQPSIMYRSASELVLCSNKT